MSYISSQTNKQTDLKHYPRCKADGPLTLTGHLTFSFYERLHNCSKNRISKGLQLANDLEGHSRSSKMVLGHILLPISGL